MEALADLEIIDAHHHLWDLAANYYPWLTDRVEKRVAGDYAAIRKDYLLSDFLADAARVNLVKSVHVQAEHDHRDPVRETRWLQAVADAPASGGFPHGIIAYADLGAPDAEAILAAHCQYPNLRGIRQMLHQGLVDPANPRPSPLDDPTWRRNVGLLHRYGLSFDLQVYPQQMEQARTLVGAYPDTQFILCHTGQPAHRDPAGLAEWQQGMRRLAELPNLCVKISGLGMFDRTWTVESIRPFVLETIATFGTDRCLFASNFPVDGMMSSYEDLWQAFSLLTADFSRDERRALFAGNARRVYRL